MPGVKKLIITLDRVEFAETCRKRFAGRLLRYLGYFKVDGGSTKRRADLREVPDESPCVIALGATGSWSVELDVESKSGAIVRFEVQAIGLGRGEQAGPLSFQIAAPFKEVSEKPEKTGDYTLYWSAVPDNVVATRARQPQIRGSRQHLKSKKATPVLVPKKPKLRAVLYAPSTTSSSSMYGAFDEAIRKDLGLGPNQQADGPHERVAHLFNVLRDADQKLRANPYLAEEQQAGQVVHLFIAPEWYFRRDQRPYTQNELITAIEEIKKRSKGDNFKRWLIVPGSIYWGMPLEWKTVESGKQLRKRVARHAKDIKNLETKIAKKDALIQKLEKGARSQRNSKKLAALQNRIVTERSEKSQLEAQLRGLKNQNPYGVGDPERDTVKIEAEIKRLDAVCTDLSNKKSAEKDPKKQKKIDAQWDKVLARKKALQARLDQVHREGRYVGPVQYKRWRVFNTVPVIHNGKLVHMYSKRFEADIADGRKRDSIEVWGMSDESVPEHAREQVASSCLFTHAGISFGIEVCRDHARGRLIKESYKIPGVHVHLVTANDVGITGHNVSARHKGCYFLCDAAGNKRKGYQVKRTKSLATARTDYDQYFAKKPEVDTAYEDYANNKDTSKMDTLRTAFTTKKGECDAIARRAIEGMTMDDLTAASEKNVTIFKLTEWS